MITRRRLARRLPLTLAPARLRRPPGFTTTVANTFIIFTECDYGDNTTDTVVPTGTTPTFTEREDDVLLYVADGTLAATGATGNYSHTCNSTGGSAWGAFLIGLNPSTGGGSNIIMPAWPAGQIA